MRVERTPRPASAAWAQRTARVCWLSSRTRSYSAASTARSRTSAAPTRLAQHLAGGRDAALAVEPALAQLRRRDAQLVRDARHLELRGELHLRRPEAAEGAVGRRVRGHGPAADAHVGALVGTAGVEDAAREHHRRQRAVGAAVHDDLDVLGDEPAVRIHARAVADDRRVALGGGRDVLVAVVDHAHRPAHPLRQQGGVDGEDRGVLLLAAEAAASLRLGDDGLRCRSGPGRA